MYYDNATQASTTSGTTTSCPDARPQTTDQHRGITLTPVSSVPRSKPKPLLTSGQTRSLEIGSPTITTNALHIARSPRRHRNLLHPRIRGRAASINSSRSKKSASSAPQSPSIRTFPSPKRNRIFRKFGMAAIIGSLQMLDCMKLGLSGRKRKVKQKVADAGPSCSGEFESGKGLLERSTDGKLDCYDIDVDMEPSEQPLSASSFMGEMEIDMEVMNLDSPITQFAAYRTFHDNPDPFATPQPSAAMSTDSLPLSSIMNSPGSRKKQRFAVSQEAAMRSRLKTLQVLGPEASAAIKMKYDQEHSQ